MITAMKKIVRQATRLTFSTKTPSGLIPIGMEKIINRRDFILKNTTIQHPPHTPEISLHLAHEMMPIWQLTEEELGDLGLPPPFWAFAWAGGQALARYVMDHPEEVKGKEVLDFASGSGVVAVAAMKAGAKSVLAADIDTFCEDAMYLNAAANNVQVSFTSSNLLDNDPPENLQVILAGDICYEQPLASHVLSWLRKAHCRGARVLIGDPGRSYFPKDGSLTRLIEYSVKTTTQLEDQEVKRTGVSTFAT